MFTQLLPSKQILTVLSLYGDWPARGGCVISQAQSCDCKMNKILIPTISDFFKF